MNVIDYFSYKLGIKVSSLLNLIFLFFLFFFIVLQFYVNTFVFSSLLGLNKYISSLIIGIVVLLYTYIGGLKTDSKTDIFQGIFMFLLIPLVFMVDKSSLTIDVIKANISNSLLFISAISLAVVQFLTLLIQPELWQRVYSSKTLKDLKKGFILAVSLFFIIFLAEIIIGISVNSSGLIKDPNNAFYEVIKIAAPSWFFPIIIVALFAAFMSTLDSSLFAISSQLAKQGIVFRNKERTETEIIKRSRISMVLVIILGLLTSWFLVDFISSVFNLLSIATIASTVILFSFILKATHKESFIALILGVITYIVSNYLGLITQNPWTILYPSLIIAAYMIIQAVVVIFYKSLQKEDNNKERLK